MTFKDDGRFCFPAWGISLVLHGAVVGFAFIFVAQVKPLPQENTFQWDVALVEEVKPISPSTQAESVVAPERPPVKQPLPSKTQPDHETLRPARPLVSTENEVITPQPAIEQLSPIEQEVEVPQLRENPAERRNVTVAERQPESVVEPKVPESVLVDPSPKPAEPQPVQQEPVAVASDHVTSPDEPVAQEDPPPASQDSAADVAPVQMAKVPERGQELKTDNRWLAESLWRRVAQLKRYPNSSRMNGEEGKVVLRAVIRSDGQLATVSVQKSSGYSALDEAAMEAVRLACPLHMKHGIGKPQIVVSLPIVYRLAN